MFIFRLTYISDDGTREISNATATEVYPSGSYKFKPYAIHFNKLNKVEDDKYIDRYKVPFKQDEQNEYKFIVDTSGLENSVAVENWRAYLSEIETNKDLAMCFVNNEVKEVEKAHGLYWLSCNVIPIYLRNLNDTTVKILSTKAKELKDHDQGTEEFNKKLIKYKEQYYISYSFVMRTFLVYYAIASSKIFDDKALSITNEHGVPILTSIMACLDLHKNNIKRFIDIHDFKTSLEQITHGVEEMIKTIDSRIYAAL